MYIGKLSEVTGVSRKAIRLYEEMGLIPAPQRKGTYRLYHSHHVIFINLIKRAQEVGFKLSEIGVLIERKNQTHQFPVDLAIELIDQKRQDISKEMQRLLTIDSKLRDLQNELPILNQTEQNDKNCTS